MSNSQHEFRRELPTPPEQSHENYASALSEALGTLDTAWQVAPGEYEREFVDDVRESVRQQLLDELELMNDGDEDE